MTIQVTNNQPSQEATKPVARETVEQSSAPAQETAQEQNQDVESDTTQTDDHAGDQESEDTETGEASDKEVESKDKPKKKNGWQRRIDKLNTRARTAEDERDYWKTQALQGKEASNKEVKKVEKPVQSQEGKPNPDDFDTHQDYMDAFTDWKIEQRDIKAKADQEKARLESERKSALKAHHDRVKAFVETVNDFEDVIEGVDDIPLSQTVQGIILASDNGPALMYELAKNREEYARISNLAPIAAARELGKLEAKIASRTSEETKSETNKITKAPKPIDPVGKGGKGVVTKSLDDPNLSQSDYERIRREQMKKRAASW